MTAIFRGLEEYSMNNLIEYLQGVQYCDYFDYHCNNGRKFTIITDEMHKGNAEYVEIRTSFGHCKYFSIYAIPMFIHVMNNGNDVQCREQFTLLTQSSWIMVDSNEELIVKANTHHPTHC